MNRKSIADRLTNARISAGKTRKEVYEALEISCSALQAYETGVRIPKDEVKIRLAEYYHTTVEALFF